MTNDLRLLRYYRLEQPDAPLLARALAATLRALPPVQAERAAREALLAFHEGSLERLDQGTATPDELERLLARAESAWRRENKEYANLPPFLYGALLNDAREEERQRALEMNEAFVLRADALLRVGDRITEGMRLEIEAWEKKRAATPTLPHVYALETLPWAP